MANSLRVAVNYLNSGGLRLVLKFDCWGRTNLEVAWHFVGLVGRIKFLLRHLAKLYKFINFSM